MIGVDDIAIYAHRLGVDPFWIENDYLQHIALYALYNEYYNELVFKGGTALQKAYGLNRLSRDLDFDMAGGINGKRLSSAVRTIGDYYPCELSQPKKVKHGIGYKIMIEGPYYKQMGIRHMLPITFNTEESPELKPLFKAINPGSVYMDPDLRTYSVLIMDPREMLAEKIRALITRKEVKPRDLYDIWFMLNNKIPADLDMVRRKVAFDHAAFSLKKLKDRIKEAGAEWDEELRPLIRDLPEYAEVSGSVCAALRL